MSYLSRQEFESITQRVNLNYRDIAKAKGAPLEFVDPCFLAREVLGLTIEYWHLSLDNSIMGLTTCAPTLIDVWDDAYECSKVFMTGSKILIEKALLEDPEQIGRLHFTIAHESCHQLLKLLFPNEYALPAQYRKVHYYRETPRKKVADWEEWKTNKLASALLMPKDLLQSHMSRAGIPDGIRMLNSVFAKEDYEKFCKVAEAMQVSKSALSIRMEELGFIKNNYLSNPYDVALIVADEYV